MDSLLVFPFKLLKLDVNRNKASPHYTTLCRNDLEVPAVGFYGQEKSGDQYQEGDAKCDPNQQLINGFDFVLWQQLYPTILRRPAYTYVSPPHNNLKLGWVSWQTRRFEVELELILNHSVSFLAAVAWLLEALPEVISVRSQWSSCPAFSEVTNQNKRDAKVLKSLTRQEVVKILKGPRRNQVAHIYDQLMVSGREEKETYFPVLLPSEIFKREDDVVLKFPLLHQINPTWLSNLALKRQFISDAAHALECLHRSDIVHHDVSLANMLATESEGGRFVLNDLGEARRMENGLVEAVVNLETTNHSPRTREVHSTDVDIWGLGHLFSSLNSSDLQLRELSLMLKGVASRPQYGLQDGKDALRFLTIYAEYHEYNTSDKDKKYSTQFLEAGVNAHLLCLSCQRYDAIKGTGSDSWIECDKCKLWRHAQCRPCQCS